MSLVIGLEQAPNPDSRVTLGERVDALGQRVARLDWRLGEAEIESSRQFVEMVVGEMERLGLASVDVGVFSLSDDPDELSGVVVDIGHHMGTTRMATDPALVASWTPTARCTGSRTSMSRAARGFPHERRLQPDLHDAGAVGPPRRPSGARGLRHRGDDPLCRIRETRHHDHRSRLRLQRNRRIEHEERVYGAALGGSRTRDPALRRRLARTGPATRRRSLATSSPRQTSPARSFRSAGSLLPPLTAVGPAHEGARPRGALRKVPGPLQGPAVVGDCQCAGGAVRTRTDTAEPRDEPSCPAALSTSRRSSSTSAPQKSGPPGRSSRGPVGPRRLRSHRVRRPGDKRRRHPGDPRVTKSIAVPLVQFHDDGKHVRRRGDRARSTPWNEHDHPRGPRPEPKGVAGSPCRSERSGAAGVVGPARWRGDRREACSPCCSCAVPWPATAAALCSSGPTTPAISARRSRPPRPTWRQTNCRRSRS